MAAVTVFDSDSQTWVTLSVSRIADMIGQLMEHQHADSPPIFQRSLLANPEDAHQPQPEPPIELEDPCENCLTHTHTTEDCKDVCGHCGQEWHTHDLCASIPRNHCKCRPFPQRHLAKRCTIVCTPDCPKADTPGSEYHRNAMMCKSRCCMCGLYGHAGRDCHLKKCRCGVEHLAIDHPREERQCIDLDCPRWFCNQHCQRCSAVLLGKKRCPECSADDRRSPPKRETGEEDRRQQPTKGLEPDLDRGRNVDGSAMERTASAGD